jgi:hypothetical protein
MIDVNDFGCGYRSEISLCIVAENLIGGGEYLKS